MRMHTYGKYLTACTATSVHAFKHICHNKAHAIMPIQQCTPEHVQCKTYRLCRLFNPVHAFEDIPEIWLLFKSLQQQQKINQSHKCCAFSHTCVIYWFISIYHMYPSASNRCACNKLNAYSWIYNDSNNSYHFTVCVVPQRLSDSK